MGRIDAIIDDNVIRDFKIEVVKRKGSIEGRLFYSIKRSYELVD